MNLVQLFTTFEGRISRTTWWFGILMLLVPSIVLMSILRGFINAAAGSPPDAPNVIASMFALLLVVPETALTTKRLNDRGHRPWVSVSFVAISILSVVLGHFDFFADPQSMAMPEIVAWAALTAYSLWLLIENGFLTGTTGPNSYGPDPLDE